MTAPALVLHMFQASHYNEKARWALDWKGLVHERRAYLPGPHIPAIRRLSGQTATPVLEIDGRVVAGSARIVAELERVWPEPALLPEEPAQRERALALEREVDDEVGPAVRTVIFAAMLDEPDFLCAVFARSQPGWKRAVYRALLPLAKPMIAKANGVVPGNVERATARTERALEDTARRVGAAGQLVGERFSVADLATAALLAPLADVDHPDMALPRPRPEPVARALARWERHPALQWVREQYAKHRPLRPELQRPVRGAL